MVGEKKKICIVTMNNKSCNLGNKLQNYAVTHIFEEKGFFVQTLAFQKQRNVFYSKMLLALNCLSNYHFAKDNEGIRRGIKYSKFVEKYIPTRVMHKDFASLAVQYDFFCIGSDQVWNPEWFDNTKKEIYLLTFAKPEQKICMAPSFGVEKLPEEWEKWFSEKLLEFPKLAVRERSGAEIIKNLTGRDAVVMIDPTMMLNAEAWRKIKKTSPNRPQQKYILTYFLGEKSEESVKQIDKIAKANDLRVLNLLSRDETKLFSTAPDEFIDLVDHAELICTDSFHACVFSILFNKPFLVYRRTDAYADMFARIENLLSVFSLENRLPGKVAETEYFWHDYMGAYRILDVERQKVYNYLEEILNSHNGE